ncbi:DUF1206 domain-containing protein [Caulobacter segnis]|uniref:DUF1206 domain-containing protein n=1 Tax=Caulobacter segnis (strain ATCC 21756 / DSM 7131 / JCM 7823 / NBRC 15250 / LMG 17158 / TK0059) TaxID=509190 RepID=D5VDM0_CAUST|nr:DUF1206 domain-containing protein [Caulobacter segnis]ADG08570.1 protein of unknown function DUF1206 [Caulobacter segnis ATCC 21756]
MSRLLEWAARLGYAARGLVYLGLGTIALLAAGDLTPQAKGATGVLETWAGWPMGLVLIGGVGCGLTGFAAWRAIQAVFDADHHGTSPKAWAIRAGQAISGLVYGGLALSAFELLDVFEDFGEADEAGDIQETSAAVLGAPHGDGLLILAGLVVIGFGVGNVIQGLTQDFGRRLACDKALCRWVEPLAKIGYAARGLATLPVGVFLMLAGLEARATEARSWGQALQTVEQRPFGGFVLGALAAGLIAFGLFGFVEARYRRISPPSELSI